MSRASRGLQRAPARAHPWSQAMVTALNVTPTDISRESLDYLPWKRATNDHTYARLHIGVAKSLAGLL